MIEYTTIKVKRDLTLKEVCFCTEDELPKKGDILYKLKTDGYCRHDMDAVTKVKGQSYFCIMANAILPLINYKT